MQLLAFNPGEGAVKICVEGHWGWKWQARGLEEEQTGNLWMKWKREWNLVGVGEGNWLRSSQALGPWDFFTAEPLQNFVRSLNMFSNTFSQASWRVPAISTSGGSRLTCRSAIWSLVPGPTTGGCWTSRWSMWTCQPTYPTGSGTSWVRREEQSGLSYNQGFNSRR